MRWLWGALGLAGAAVLGIVVSRKMNQATDKPKPARNEWQLISRIDAALSEAGIYGVEVYLRQQKVVLIAAPQYRAQLERAVEVVQNLEGATLIDALIREESAIAPEKGK